MVFFKRFTYFQRPNFYIVEEFKKDCWNTSVIYGNIDYKDIIFKKLFSAKKCVHSIDNIDKEFNAHQSGQIIFYYP